MSRWKPVKQPVFGSNGRQCPRCGRWFRWANYWRDYKLWFPRRDFWMRYRDLPGGFFVKVCPACHGSPSRG